MARIPDAFIDDLLARSDIVEVVGSRVPLKRQGKEYAARCPFHDERSASFTVSPTKQFYHCFGCGAHGTAISFLMNYDRLEFLDAVDELAKRAGMEVPRSENPRNAQQQDDSRELYSALDAATKFFQKNLEGSEKARTYLDGRGVDEENRARFQIGYAPDGYSGLRDALGKDERRMKLLDRAGLFSKNDRGHVYDKFRDRVMFPIFDRRGRVIAFGGRVFEKDDGPKYLNSPETALFHKGRELYGLWQVRQANQKIERLIVVEGYMDVIALAQQGLRNAVATLGTATSEEHLKRLFRIVPSVLFCFDGDAAGRKAAWRALEATLPNLQDGRRARFLFLPDGEDPDTLVRAEGTDAFRARIQQHSQPLADYFFQQLSDEADPRSLEGKAHLATLAAPLIEKIPGANLRALMRQRLTEITGLNGEALQHMAAAPTTAPNNNSVEYDDAAYYDTGSHYAETDYFQPPEAPKPQRGEKKEWKKDWKKSGQRPDFKPRGPRTPATVEPPTLTTLRTLLHHPELAQKVENVSHFAAEDDTYAQLLVALLGTLQKNPKLRSLQLIARWHGTDQGRLLRALAEKEWLISADNLEQQFFDTINSLAARQRERRLESLLRKARQGELSAEEKDQLRNLLSRNAIPATPTSTGV